METKKELEETIEKEYEDNKRFLKEQFKKVTDKNVMTILMENIHTLEGNDNFTELDLLETIIGIVNLYELTEVNDLSYHFKETQIVWNLYNRQEKLKELENETN